MPFSFFSIFLSLPCSSSQSQWPIVMWWQHHRHRLSRLQTVIQLPHTNSLKRLSVSLALSVLSLSLSRFLVVLHTLLFLSSLPNLHSLSLSTPDAVYRRRDKEHPTRVGHDVRPRVHLLSSRGLKQGMLCDMYSERFKTTWLCYILCVLYG